MILRQHRMVSYGVTRSGKSELARLLWINFAPPRVCIDVKDEHAERLPGVPTIDSPAELFTHGPTVRAVPPDPGDERWYEEIYTRLWDEGNVFTWLDEANEVTRPNYIPRKMRKVVLQGEGRGMGHISCTPRPADEHPSFRSQASQVFTFKLGYDRDFVAVAGLFGMKPADFELRNRALPGYHYLHRDEDGHIEARAPQHDPDELTDYISTLYFGPYDRASQNPWSL